MLYSMYEMQRSMLAGASAMTGWTAEILQNPANPLAYMGVGPIMASALDVFSHASAPRGKPVFGIDHSLVDGKHVHVSTHIEARKPFGQLKHFVKEGVEGQPKLLIVAPMSGHFATLLKDTVERMLPGHDVWITDWRDAKTVPVSEGSFDLDDYIDYVVEFLEHIGPGAHMLAVCQPSVPCLAAAAVMSKAGHPDRPSTLTMMGGPIDTREAPTAVNTLATQRPHAWFEQNVVATVPLYYPGAGRKVYPGFLQLAGFMSMNLGNHMISHWEMFKHLVEGDGDSAEATKEFYEEYRSVADMTAEFYLQTVDVVFQRHALATGDFTHRGEPVDPGDIADIALLAIEGERDDISGIGQTRAALTLAEKLPEKLKRYHMAPEVGHYGIFHGRKWREQIAPVVEDWIATHN